MSPQDFVNVKRPRLGGFVPEKTVKFTLLFFFFWNWRERKARASRWAFPTNTFALRPQTVCVHMIMWSHRSYSISIHCHLCSAKKKSVIPSYGFSLIVISTMKAFNDLGFFKLWFLKWKNWKHTPGVNMYCTCNYSIMRFNVSLKMSPLW